MMKKKTKIMFAVGTVFMVLMAFTLSVSAVEIDTERVESSNILSCELSTMYGIDYYILALEDVNGGYNVLFFTPSYDTISALFSESGFLLSNQSGYEYVNSHMEGFLDFLSTSSIMYANLNSFQTYLNNLGEKFRLDYRTSQDLRLQLEELEREYNALEYSYLLLENDFENLQLDYELLQSDFHSLEQDVDMLNFEITDLTNRLNKAISDNEVAYNNGLNDGLEIGDAVKNGFNEFFNAPFYVLKEVFNFELFGINFYNILKFMLTMAVTGFVIKTFV